METKVLSIDVKEAINQLADLTLKIERLTAKNAELRKQIKDLKIDEEAHGAVLKEVSAEYEDNYKVISVLTDARRVLRREIVNSIKQDEAEVGSLRALRAEVA